MYLNGQKNRVNVTLQIREKDFVLLVDSAHKVVRVEYTNETKFGELRAHIDSLASELGYTPKNVTHAKVKQFNFNK